MARAGISEYHVVQAAERLKALGINPTVDNVRRELGDTGSRTTINNHLRTWREQSQQKPLNASDLSVSLQSLLGEQAKSLLLALETEAAEKFRTEREQYELALQQKNDAEKELEAQLQNREQSISGLQNTIENQHQELTSLQIQLAEAQDEIQTLRENRASLQATVTHLHQQLQELKAQIVRTAKAHEQELAERNKSISHLRENLAAEKQAKIIQAARLNDLEHQIPALQAEFKKAYAESMRIRNEAQAAVQQANESRQRAEQDIKAAEKALADRDHEIGELRREITALRQQDQQRIAELASAVSELGKKLDLNNAKPSPQRRKASRDK